MNQQFHNLFPFKRKCNFRYNVNNIYEKQHIEIITYQNLYGSHHVRDLMTRKDKTAELEVSCTEHLANYATSLSNLPTTRKGINIITQQEQPQSKQVCTWASPAAHCMSAWLNTCTMPRPWTLVHILPNTGCYTILPLTPCHHLNTR